MTTGYRNPSSLLNRRFIICGLFRRRRWLSLLRVSMAMMIIQSLVYTFTLSGHSAENDPLGGAGQINKRSIKSLQVEFTRMSLARNDTLGQTPRTFLSWDDLNRRGPSRRDVSCPALFRGDTSAIKTSQRHMKQSSSKFISDTDYLHLTKDCQSFRTQRGYIMNPLSQEEANFPLAFSILMYKDVFQVERLLRAIYMPQNFYCIHTDAKASASIHLAMKAITSCFPNVFVSSRLRAVHWGHISIVKAELTCMEELMQYPWKYYLNLSGQMFPLQTNRNLVNILKMYNGANDVEGSIQRNNIMFLAVRHKMAWRLWESIGRVLPQFTPKSPPPHNLTLYKGSNQVAISRAFSEFVLSNEESKDLLAWMEDINVPDEYYLPTLNHNAHLNAPGGYRGNPENKVLTARASLWTSWDLQMDLSWKHWECQGQWVRHICILGVGDLPWTHARPELFVNKLYYDFEPLALDCIEELIFNRTKYKVPFDPSYYKRLAIVRQRHLVNIE